MQKRTPWLLLATAVVVSLVLAYPYLALDIHKSRIDVSGALRYGAQAPSMIPVGQTLAWIVNLAVIEAVIRTRRLTTPCGGVGSEPGGGRKIRW
ncbi:hypothetical protein ACQPWW_12100 [Micromonospora sp. CA-240977]|uniref:hypothetical protein n=1 Tax=Micromonospora sp. CA-240977 TaxID=3239957 RepID=UPI003D939E4E